MINNSDFFLFSVFLWWFCGLWIATTSAKSRNDEGVKGNDFFLFSVFLWWFCGLWIATTSTKSRNDEWGKGWYSQTRHCESCLQLVAISVWSTMTVKQNSSLRGFEKAVAISVWGIILFIHGILFIFCFYIYFLWLVGVCLPL